jgi:hypothetical protein
MPEHNLFRIFVSRFNKLSIPYMITGAVASIIYGEPRLTNDIDLSITVKVNPKSICGTYLVFWLFPQMKLISTCWKSK